MEFLDVIEDNFEKFSSKRAIILKSERNQICLTYKNLKSLSNDLYFALINKVQKNTCFGLIMEKNVYIPAIIIGLMKLDCSFIFLNVTSNLKSVLNIINNLKLKWIITVEICVEEWKDAFNEVPISIKNFPIKIWNTTVYETCLYRKICYVIQTSGTTGTSKFVKVEYKCIASNIYSLKKIFKLTSQDIIYYGTSLYFDPSMVELFLSLVIGSCLLILPDKIMINPNKLLNFLFPDEDQHVSLIQMCPSVFLRWNKIQIEHILNNTNLKILLLGGEQFPIQVLNTKRKKSLNIYNIYGITELSCWASIMLVDSSNDVNLGSDLDDTILEVRGENNLKIVEGEGELFVGSFNRICYLNNENESTVQLPLFRSTGDIVKLTDCKKYYIGRKNDFIKRFGCRVSLNAIEEIIFKEMNIFSVCLWFSEYNKLVLFVKTNEENKEVRKKTKDKIRVKLLHTLEKECFPDEIISIQNFPLTVNGKICKNSLKNLYDYEVNNKGQTLEPLKVFENLLKIYFGLDEIRNYSDLNFFDLGGNSILVMLFLNEFIDILNIEFPNELAVCLYEHKISKCCDHVKNMFPLHKKKLFSNEKNVNSELAGSNLGKTYSIILEILWKYDLKACVDTTAEIFKYLDKIFVAVGSFSNIFVVLNFSTGEVISKTVLPDSIENKCCVMFDFQHICVGCRNGVMYCIEVLSGRIKWEYVTNDIIKNCACLCKTNEAVVFGSYDKYVYCLESCNGELIWKTFVESCVTSSPIYSDVLKIIFIATLNGSIFSLNENDGSILWYHKFGVPIFSTPTLVEYKGIYFTVWANVQGKIFALNCESGKELWSFRTSGLVYSSLVNNNKEIFFTCKDHNFYCIEYKYNNCILKYKIILNASLTKEPCIFTFNSKLFITLTSDNGDLYILDYNSGEIVSYFKLPNQSFSSPKVFDGKIVIGCRDNYLYCFDIKI